MKYGIYRTVKRTKRLIAYATSLEYQGDWMSSRYVQVDVKSPIELEFAVGDYVDYRGERFELKNATAIKKQANSGKYGEAFTYSGIKFESYLDELVATACINYTFTDESSGTVGGSLLSEFSLHCETVQDLVNLIAANMKRAYNQGIISSEWEFNVAEGGETDVTIDISNINCLEALKKVYDEFGLGFKIDKASRSVYVGSADDNYNEFLFGKGNGLRDIERQVNTDYDLITRLRVVGNTTNMPRHYYYYLQIKPYGFTVKGALTYSQGGSTTKTYQTYRISSAGSFFFNLPYGVKVNSGTTLPISINGKSCTATYWGTADDYKLTTIDEEVQELIDTTFETIEAGGTPDAGIFSFEIDDDYIKSCPNGKKTWKASGNADLLPLANLMPTSYDVYNSDSDELETNATYGDDGSNFVLDPYFDSVNIAKYGIREAYVEFTSDDDEKGIEDIYPTIENETNTVKEGSTITDDGIFDNGETVSGFQITINDIGFNLNNTRPDGQSNYGTLCMKTGLLGGREFEISSVTYNAIDGTQVLTCKRVEDDATDTYMPNKYWQIAEGDEFVITNIEMPDSYVEDAGDYLAEQAREYLSKYDHPHYNYNVSIDNIYLARDYDSNGEDSIYYNIKEGDYLKIQDEDLIGVDDDDALITEKISIDKLTIKEQEGKIPQVSVTLRNEKKENTITRITRTTSAISSATSSAMSSVRKSIKQINSEIDSESEDSVIHSGNVSFTANQTSGSELGTLTIDGVSNVIYAPDYYIRNDKDASTEHSLTIGQNLYVGSNTLYVNSEDEEVTINGTLGVSSSITAKGLGTVGYASSEKNYLLGINSGGSIKKLPTRISFTNTTLTLGSGNDTANLVVNGNLDVSGTMNFDKFTADNGEFTTLTSTSATILGNKINTSYGDNSIIAFNYGLASDTSDSDGLVWFFSKPSVMHYINGEGWVDFSVLDLYDVVEEIDSDEITDKVVTDRAVDAFVKDYVTENAVTPLDVTALTTEGGTITSCMKNLLHQPLYVKSDSSYASAKLLCKSGGSTSVAWLLWDVVTTSVEEPKTIRHYAMELTGANQGAVPYQTDGIIEAYSLYYRDETNAWDPA